MVNVSLDGATLRLTIEGMDQIWALKSTLSFRIEHISEVTRDPAGIHDWWKGLRMGGTQMPGLIAGTFLYHGDRVFWDVHNPGNAIGITLFDERYKELIFEVEDPEGVVDMIRQALQSSY